jgi:hypothetical protein
MLWPNGIGLSSPEVEAKYLWVVTDAVAWCRLSCKTSPDAPVRLIGSQVYAVASG